MHNYVMLYFYKWYSTVNYSTASTAGDYTQAVTKQNIPPRTTISQFYAILKPGPKLTKTRYKGKQDKVNLMQYSTNAIISNQTTGITVKHWMFHGMSFIMYARRDNLWF